MSDALEVDGLIVGPCMVRSYREQLEENEATIEALRVELVEKDKLIDRQHKVIVGANKWIGILKEAQPPKPVKE